MFDTYFGGAVSSRAKMQEKIRQMKTDGSVIEETAKAVESRTAAELVDAQVSINKERQWKIIQNTKSAPYCGERY
ncbi:hypothetical protein OEG79_10500 [Pseudomonas sp. Z8(2022)]|uniref:hypothetical protein n=1 Tax=Pseudomonas sp. Z8(2022) TaxID=2962597 RepID=UPI0021F400FE|nr:hypothetical protein [Pseudomonas sp. Z8(2022)]UYP28527.1 hypothetical protein OEG79_10550 [Pseudomonas sp. Z8(2022)]UYP28537.1 hypothetical protein OEG79_10600 [Pseudomonas sp. Z8(2022)]UYP32487.1 hypothetical protein OEG79_10500 [Pseudomonas sp. Z8(2022)]